MFLLVFCSLLSDQAWGKSGERQYAVKFGITLGEIVIFIPVIAVIIFLLWLIFLKPKFPSSWELETENPPNSYRLRSLQKKKFYKLSVSLGSANEDVDLGAPGPIGRIIPKYGGRCVLRLGKRMLVKVDGREKEAARLVLSRVCKVELGDKYEFAIRVN